MVHMLGVFFMIVDVSYFPSGKVVETLQILGMYGKRSDGIKPDWLRKETAEVESSDTTVGMKQLRQLPC